MHIVTCSNYFDLNKTVALRTGGGSTKKILIFCKFSNKFFNNFSISLVQSISVLDKSRKFVFCVRIDYENKTQMLSNPSIQFFIDPRGVTISREERYPLRSAEVYMWLEQTVVFIRQLPPETCRYIQNLLIKALNLAAFYIDG